MKKTGKYLLIAILILGAILMLWWINSLAAAKEDFYTKVLNRRDSAARVGEAFTLALWLKNDIAYEITDPTLWGELNNWMNTHTAQDCSILNSGQLDSVGSPTNPQGAYYSFSCDSGSLSLDNVQVQQNSSGKWYIIHWDIFDSSLYLQKK